MKLIRQETDKHSKCKLMLIFIFGSTLLGCASPKNKYVLADLKSRYWKGTYYLSVKDSPTSIKCSIGGSYQDASDIPVTYQGQDAKLLFVSEEDQAKILKLQEQCFSGPLK
jgi:hypothetical protein